MKCRGAKKYLESWFILKVLKLLLSVNDKMPKGGYGKTFLDHLSLDEMLWSLKIPRMLVCS